MIPVSILGNNYYTNTVLSDEGVYILYITKEQYDILLSGVGYIDIHTKSFKKIDLSQEEKKQELISQIQKIQELSLAKRLEYTTVMDMLPEGNPIRDMKMQVLEYEGDKLLLQYEELVQELIENYGQSALYYII